MIECVFDEITAGKVKRKTRPSPKLLSRRAVLCPSNEQVRA
jgi:hypothetical protein